MRIHSMALGSLLVGIALLLVSVSASAYRLQTKDGKTCSKDGTECQVYCTDDDHKGTLAGSMFWNGSVWTDGVKWDENQDTEAKLITAANKCS
jgi:hypothetical protein